MGNSPTNNNTAKMESDNRASVRISAPKNLQPAVRHWTQTMLQYVKEKPFIDLSPREQSEVLGVIQELVPEFEPIADDVSVKIVGEAIRENRDVMDTNL
ncbi:hypothetical protein OQA88_12691 [Cercophora sp. LCS_1]